jgi:type I restriction enzyme S subunit
MNWQIKKLIEIGTIFNGNSINERIKKEKYFDLHDGLPFIATKDIDFETHSINYNNGVKIPLAEKSFKIAHKNSVLICAEGGSAGKKIAFNERDICFGNKLFAIEANEDVNPKLVYYWYLTPMFFDAFKKQMNGIIGGVSIGNFKNLEIPLPSLLEQKRIVKIIDEVFEKIAKVKENTEKNLQNSKDLFESYLQNTFANSGKNWERRRLGEVCLLTRGHNPPKSKFIRDAKEGYIRFYQIRDGWTDNYAVYVPDTPQLHKVEPHEILMVAYRHIGKVFRGVSGAFNVALCKISNNSKDVLDDDFLFYMIPTNIIKGELMKRSGRSLIPSMSVEHLKEIIIPLPSLIEQKNIVRKLDKLSAETKKLEAIYRQKLADLEELKKSVLKKAFAGEL